MISSAPTGVPAKAREKRPTLRKNRNTMVESQMKCFLTIANLLRFFRQPPGEKNDERGEQKDRGRRRKQHDGHHEDPHGDVRGQGGEDHRGEALGEKHGVPENPLPRAGHGPQEGFLHVLRLPVPLPEAAPPRGGGGGGAAHGKGGEGGGGGGG